MSKEIEEFLRRAAQRRAQGGAAPAPPAPAAPPPAPPRSLVAEVLEAEVVEDAEQRGGIMRGESVGSHVSQHLDTRATTERLAHLGEDVGQSDDRMESHLHQYFEHKLGDLGGVTSAAEDSTLDPDSPAGRPAQQQPAGIMQWLASPESLQQAIILGEIFNRPKF